MHLSIRALVGASVLPSLLAVGAELELVGRLSHEALAEVSGIVKSARGDFYWVHNDSGDSPRLFAIDGEGTPLKPPWMPIDLADWPGHAIDNATHFDWEDIALADGVLYVADVGNNGNARRDLGVYVVNEPDPLAIPRMRALSYLPVRYPDQEDHPGDVWHFDCEAVFVADGVLHFLTKHRQSRQIGEGAPGTKAVSARYASHGRRERAHAGGSARRRLPGDGGRHVAGRKPPRGRHLHHVVVVRPPGV